jgi:hypothetical protein
MKLFVTLPGDTLLICAKRVKKRKQGKPYTVSLVYPFPFAKFGDKHRPQGSDTVVGGNLVCICSLSTALRRIRLFAKIV